MRMAEFKLKNGRPIAFWPDKVKHVDVIDDGVGGDETVIAVEGCPLYVVTSTYAGAIAEINQARSYGDNK